MANDDHGTKILMMLSCRMRQLSWRQLSYYQHTLPIIMAVSDVNLATGVSLSMYISLNDIDNIYFSPNLTQRAVLLFDSNKFII